MLDFFRRLSESVYTLKSGISSLDVQELVTMIHIVLWELDGNRTFKNTQMLPKRYAAQTLGYRLVPCIFSYAGQIHYVIEGFVREQIRLKLQIADGQEDSTTPLN